MRARAYADGRDNDADEISSLPARIEPDDDFDAIKDVVVTNEVSDLNKIVSMLLKSLRFVLSKLGKMTDRIAGANDGPTNSRP